VTISDIELTYLDGVSSNIQTQINNINTNNSALTTTVATHTTQIAALEASDTSQNTTLSTHTSQISALQTSDTSQNTTLATHTSQISAIQTVNATQTSDINSLNFAVTGLSSTVTSLGTDVSNLNTKTQNITANTTSTSMSKPLYINSNGQSNTASLELVDSFSSNATSFYPNIIAGSFNHIINSGDQAIVARGTIDTETLNLTTHSSVSSGVRISPSSVVMGVGGTTSTPTNRMTCDTGAVNIHGTLNLDCGNAKITTAGNMTVGIINSNASGENIKMTGNHSYIAGYDLSAGTRDYYVGTPGAGVKNLLMVNEKAGSITMYTGTDGITPSIIGRNKLNTYSTGLRLYRGGVTEVYGGEIGLSNVGNDVFHILGSGTNDIYVDALTSGNISLNVSGTRAITLNSNVLWVGSSTANANGRKSNINMYNATGTGWETQSSAFTEALKSQITTNQTNITALQNARTYAQTAIARITLTNAQIFGRNWPLNNSTVYGTLTNNLSLGLRLNLNGYSSYFNANGEWIYNGGATQRVSIRFDGEFNSGATGITSVVSRIKITTSTGTDVIQSMKQGVRYNQGGGNPINNILYWTTGEFVCELLSGYEILLETENAFSTSGDGSTRTLTGRLTFYLINY